MLVMVHMLVMLVRTDVQTEDLPIVVQHASVIMRKNANVILAIKLQNAGGLILTDKLSTYPL